MKIWEDFEKMNAYLVGSPWMANLSAALDSKTKVALVVGTVDNCILIRDVFGLISLDHVFPMIDKAIHEKFGEKRVWWGAAFPYFLILLTGDEAENAAAVAESIRTTVESMTFDERFNVTMHFGVTEASSNWATAGGFRGLLNAVDRAIELGKLKVVANRVYGPADVDKYEQTVAKKR